MIKRGLVLLLTLLCAVPMFARHHVRRFWHRGPAIIFPARGMGAQIAQNQEIDRLGIPRIANDRQLSAMIERGDLVPVTPTSTLTLSPHLPKGRAYVCPWVYTFLLDLSARFYAEFGTPLQVNSAVRPVTVQRRLRRVNSNAAPVSGENASAHLAGVAVDLQRRGLTDRQIRWLQLQLLLHKIRGEVLVIEELRHPCFHVMVTGRYPNPAPMEVEPPQEAAPLEPYPDDV